MNWIFSAVLANVVARQWTENCIQIICKMKKLLIDCTNCLLIQIYISNTQNDFLSAYTIDFYYFVGFARIAHTVFNWFLFAINARRESTVVQTSKSGQRSALKHPKKILAKHLNVSLINLKVYWLRLEASPSSRFYTISVLHGGKKKNFVQVWVPSDRLLVKKFFNSFSVYIFLLSNAVAKGKVCEEFSEKILKNSWRRTHRQNRMKNNARNYNKKWNNLIESEKSFN